MKGREYKSYTIILCGGKIDFYSLPLNTNTSNSMIPINGKPVIAWILNDLISKGLRDIVIVMRQEDDHLEEFVNRVFCTPENSLNIKLVFLKTSGTILHSLQAGIEVIETPSSSIRVLLGDTLILDPFDEHKDHIYIQEVEDSYRWCLAQLDDNGQVTGYLEKVMKANPPYNALCGYYHFQDQELLKVSLNQALSQKSSQISDLLSVYSKSRNIQAKHCVNWYDFGNIDNLVKAKQQLLQSRFFNSLSIDPVLNTITKISSFDEKLNNELNWYLELPAELQVLTPRIVSSEPIDGKLNLVQEYYGYPTLAELYLYSDLHPESWISIMKKLLGLHSEFRKYRKPFDKENFRKVYLEKTLNRLTQLKNSDQYWMDLFKEPFIELNGKQLINIGNLMPEIEELVSSLVDNATATIIHGDFCFSNILFDINGQIARLIDPRGSFGEPGIYGDPRYDLAKLRHSVCGWYDYIVSDLFDLKENGPIFETRIFFNNTAQTLAGVFDELIIKFGYNAHEIKLIEALLFISMVPLHKDQPSRQKMMFTRGIYLLNQIIDENSN